MIKKTITMSEDYLKQVSSMMASKLVGKLCKRFELTDDISLLKKEAKELIYESYRDFKDILLAYDKGKEITIWKFQSTIKPNSSDE